MVDDAYPRDLIGYGRHPPHPRWPNRRASGVAVRAQSRGGRRRTRSCMAMPPPRRFCPRSSAHRPFPMRHLSMESLYEYGIACRTVARVARLRAAQGAAHGFCSRDGVAAPPGSDGGFRGARPRNRLPWPALDQLPADGRGDRARAPARSRRDRQTTDRRSAARLVHGTRQSQHASAIRRTRRVRVRRRFVR